jgi:hypothetical protein
MEDDWSAQAITSNSSQLPGPGCQRGWEDSVYVMYPFLGARTCLGGLMLVSLQPTPSSLVLELNVSHFHAMPFHETTEQSEYECFRRDSRESGRCPIGRLEG